ncbi:hypothetical protein ACHAWF_016531 [Thalassiosira exigua]
MARRADRGGADGRPSSPVGPRSPRSSSSRRALPRIASLGALAVLVGVAVELPLLSSLAGGSSGRYLEVSPPRDAYDRAAARTKPIARSGPSKRGDGRGAGATGGRAELLRPDFEGDRGDVTARGRDATDAERPGPTTSKSSSPRPPPPEPLDAVDFCAEKCRYVSEVCSHNLHRDRLSLPAPRCLNYSLTVPDDIYWRDFARGGRRINAPRDEKTSELVKWGARRARERRLEESAPELATPCEDRPTNHSAPMMFPEEFEFFAKLLINAEPRTYLEWGCGMSTSFYPLLASGTVVAIDGYPPWCEKVGSEPRVKCMREEEGRLRFHCEELRGAVGDVGKLSRSASDADVEAAMAGYVGSIDGAAEEANVAYFDVALVDGRFRVQCALKLLPYLKSESVLIMHDFWVRYRSNKEKNLGYGKVLDYYYVIGYARSIVALRKKEGLSEEVEASAYKSYMKKEHLDWVDVK